MNLKSKFSFLRKIVIHKIKNASPANTWLELRDRRLNVEK